MKMSNQNDFQQMGTSKLNALNAFRLLDLGKPSGYLDEEGAERVSDRFQNIELAARNDERFRSQSQTYNDDGSLNRSSIPLDILRRSSRGPGMAEDRLGPLIAPAITARDPKDFKSKDKRGFRHKGGYSLYSDEAVGIFFWDCYLRFKALGIDEPRFLVNHALQQPFGQIIYVRSDYKADLGIDSRVANLFHQLLRHNVSVVSIDDFDLKAKKTTSPGPPFTIKGKGFYEIDDILWGIQEDFADRFVNALKKDYYKVKASWFNDIERIYFDQWNFEPENVDDSNFQDYYFNHVLITAVMGYRLNSIDKVLNADEAKDHRHMFLTKPRKYMYIDRKGIVHWGTINIKNLATLARDTGAFPHGLAPNRRRMITRANYVANLPSMVISKMVTTPMEEGVNSFASIREDVVKGYLKFLSRCNSSKGKFHFINGDRSNAETFVSSNFDQFIQLIPPEWRKLYKAQCTVLMFADYYYCFQGLSSGIAKTTELNWIMGTYEATRAISILVKKPHWAVCQAYFESIISNEPYFCIGDYIVKLFMPTDDIPLVIYGPDLGDVVKILGEGTGKMEWNVSDSEMTTFGMRFTTYSLTAAETSPLSKFFYDETPGFYYKTAFSLCAKYDAISRDIQQEVDYLYMKHFGCDINAFRPHANMYQAWLKSLGVRLEDIFDQYSPSNKLIFSKYVSEDPLNQSMVVPKEHYKGVFDHFKNLNSKYTGGKNV